MAKPLAAILKSYSDVIAGKLPASEVNKLTLGKEPGVDYDPKMPNEREFVASHSVEKHPDRVGNGPEVYNGANVKQAIDDRHGHIPNPKSKNQYKQANEEVEQINEALSADHKIAITKHIKKMWGKGTISFEKEHGKHFVSHSDGIQTHVHSIDMKKGVPHVTHFMSMDEEVKLDEKKDDREYDYEGEMAVTKLKTICRHAEHLIDMMKPNTNLPEWVQSKIVKAEDYISTAHDYLMSEMNEEVEQIDELTGYRKKKLFGKDKLVAVANRAINRMKLPPNNGEKLSPKDLASNKKNSKVSRMAVDRMEEEVELDEGGSQYRSTAGSGKNTNPNLSRLARKLAFEKPKSYRPPGEKSKAENRAILDAEVAKFMKKGGKIRKEEVEELDEAKCNMSEAGTMCEVHGMKACPKEGSESASDKEPRYTGKNKEGRQLITDKKTISEVLTKKTPVGKVISDFEKSDDPRFKGDSKEKRKERALAAWYKMHPEKSKKKMKEESSPADTTITFPSGNSREGFKL